MKTLRLTLLLTLFVAAVSLVRAEDDPAKKDLAQIQGEWSMVSGTADGFEIPAEMVATARRVCKGNDVTATVGDRTILKAKFTLDPSKTPKTIDYDVQQGSNAGKKILGIYELNGDTFKACFGAPGAPRPTEFSSKPDSKQTSTVWKRSKASETKTEKKPEQKDAK